jgi:hypothetical protein
MNISLDRLIEGIIATLRTDVIPRVSDPYGRGQAVGVIDLLNNIAPRLDWAREPIETAVSEKLSLLGEVEALIPELKRGEPLPRLDPSASTPELIVMRDRLDAAICDALVRLEDMRRTDGKADQAIAILVDGMRRELKREMKLTRKPLFAEIASGSSAVTDAAAGLENGRGG